MDVPKEPSVFVWSASFYNQTTHHWEYGELQVTPSALCFYDHTSTISTPEKQARSLRHKIKIDNITEVKKTLSSYFFKCLLILTKDGIEHWFGSLPGRDGAYNTILHFWRERLLDQPHRSSDENTTHTKLGRELLTIAQDSSSTLKESGETLHQQGEQLSHARNVLFDLHNDLDVADHMTTNLESWFGHWGFSEHNLPSEPVELVTAKGVPIIHEFPVLYHAGGGNLPHHHHTYNDLGASSVLNKLHLSPRRGPPIGELPGHLRLSGEGATILDANQVPVYHFKVHDISTVNVSSPWKISIVKYCLGEPDIVYKITSVQMVNVLPVLHSIVNDRMQYESSVGPPVGDPVWPHVGKLGQMNVTENQIHCNSIVECLTSKVPADLEIMKKSLPKNNRNLQRVKTKEVVSDVEVKQLSGLIGEMKSAALDIQVEQDKQNETIDQLSGLVDKANDRLKIQKRKKYRLM